MRKQGNIKCFFDIWSRRTVLMDRSWMKGKISATDILLYAYGYEKGVIRHNMGKTIESDGFESTRLVAIKWMINT